MIPQSFIDDLLSRTDIVEVVRTRVQLKRAGKDWTACCPFHDEKSPSFSVSPTKQFYHCFGCGAHGNAVGFLMEYDRLEFPAAVEQLAHQAGVPMPESDSGDGAARTAPIFKALMTAQDQFRRWLTPDCSASEYLKQRGISPEMRDQFGLGYAPAGWNSLSDKLGDKKSAEAAGLIIRKDTDQAYDRFRDRLMFPIRDLRGRVVGFGGRTLGDDKAKYLNSPETPVFHKGRLVYGLYEARQANRKLEQLLVVEGYMDVIALAQFGFPFAVATLGTATTEEHLRLLLRQASRLVFCFDGDSAGRRAAHKALDVSLAEYRDGLDIRFLFLPEGEDPDSLVRREGQEPFAARLQAATPLSELLLERLLEGLDPASTDGQSALIARARQALEPVKAEAFRQIFLERIVQRTQLRQASVDKLVGHSPAGPRTRRPIQPPQRMTPARKAIALLLQNPALATAAVDLDGLAQSAEPGAALLAELIALCRSNPELHWGAISQRYSGRPEHPHLLKLATAEIGLQAEAAQADFAESCALLLRRDFKAERRLQELSQLNPSAMSEEQKREFAVLMGAKH